uniref:Alpha-type protein kinase domain-containing protein n=1 Tax=Palpitomonas bilix TaxID=652834 RepID=A0A7S3GC88_9EUKA|mmetsp:Transcript_41412/g.107283  ORF Transcript_41412/g.107283 Transcript_41412/m.107283 type:complete len:514 (+) Transcript_41412:69-1610(+)
MASASRPAQQRARKWTFDYDDAEWKVEDISLFLSPRGFSSGAMRVSYKCNVDDGEGGGYPSVVKFFKGFTPQDQRLGVKSEKNKEQYYTDCYTQVVCDAFAQYFNRKAARLGVPVVGFVPCSVLELFDYQPPLFGFFEPYLEGRYKKYNNNGGWVAEQRESGSSSDSYLAVANAFSHFTLVASGFDLLVCDIQGVMDYFTDPQIHFLNERKRSVKSAGDRGRKGVIDFCQSHRCTRYCRLLRLPKLYSDRRGGVILAEVLEKYEAGRRWLPGGPLVPPPYRPPSPWRKTKEDEESESRSEKRGHDGKSGRREGMSAHSSAHASFAHPRPIRGDGRGSVRQSPSLYISSGMQHDLVRSPFRTYTDGNRRGADERGASPHLAQQVVERPKSSQYRPLRVASPGCAQPSSPFRHDEDDFALATALSLSLHTQPRNDRFAGVEGAVHVRRGGKGREELRQERVGAQSPHAFPIQHRHRGGLERSWLQSPSASAPIFRTDDDEERVLKAVLKKSMLDF